MRKLLLSVIMLLASSSAFASATKPVCLDKIIQAQSPYGEGKMNKLFMKVYDAALWTDAKQWSMDSTFALSINYDLSIDGDDLVDRSIEEMEHTNPIPAEKVDSYKQQLTKVFPDVKKGDTITALYDPKKGVTFFYNNKLYGAIKDQDLSKRFLSIWFAPNTSEPTLRASLLGANNG